MTRWRHRDRIPIETAKSTRASPPSWHGLPKLHKVSLPLDVPLPLGPSHQRPKEKQPRRPGAPAPHGTETERRERGNGGERRHRLKGPQSSSTRSARKRMTATPKACFRTFFSYQSQRRVAWTRNQGNLPRQALQRQDRGHLGFVCSCSFCMDPKGLLSPVAGLQLACSVRTLALCPIPRKSNSTKCDRLVKGLLPTIEAFLCSSVIRCALFSLPTSIACLPRSSGKCIASTKHSPG